MANAIGPVTAIFDELISAGHIQPVEHMEDLRLPGELTPHSTFTTYSTPNIPIRTGVDTNAELEQRPEGNIAAPGHVFRIGI